MKTSTTNFLLTWRRFMEKCLTSLSLYLIYFLGIGASAFFAKLIGKKFLDKNSAHSNWQKISKKQQTNANLEKMY